MHPNPPRRHHYIPQCLLKRFASKTGTLWQYDTGTGTVERRHKSKAGFERDLYTRRLDGPNPDYETVERDVFGPIENAGSLALDDIEAKKALTAKKYAAFITFAAALYHRTPATFQKTREVHTPAINESFQRVARNKKFHDRVRKRMLSEGKCEAEVSRLIQSLISGEWEGVPTHELIMATCIDSIKETQREFYRMGWCFCSVPEGGGDLVLGDHPVTFADLSGDQPPNLGYCNPNIEIVLPISSRMAAVARWNAAAKYADLPKGSCSEINDRSFRFAHKYVFARDQTDTVLARALALKGTGPRILVDRFEMPNGGLLIRKSWFQPPEKAGEQGSTTAL